MAELILEELDLAPQWRVFAGPTGVDGLVWSVSPGEWTVFGPQPEGETVELTHVRAVFRITGTDAARLLNKLCSLDLGDDAFPEGASARTLVAGVATELVRNDQNGAPSYLVIPSRSFGAHMRETLQDASKEFGLV